MNVRRRPHRLVRSRGYVTAAELHSPTYCEWQVLRATDLGIEGHIGSVNDYVELFYQYCVREGEIGSCCGFATAAEVALVRDRQHAAFVPMNYQFASRFNRKLRLLGFQQYVIRSMDRRISPADQECSHRRRYRFGRLPARVT